MDLLNSGAQPTTVSGVGKVGLPRPEELGKSFDSSE